MRLERSILFFERRIANAIQNRKEVKSPIAEENWRDGAPKGEELRLEERSAGVGSRDEAKTRRVRFWTRKRQDGNFNATGFL
jgi:hypothetical protein